MNATFSINPEFSGIEITFPGKPSEEVRESLKFAGFRWHNVRRIWYAKQNPARLALAHALTGSTGSAENKENAEKSETVQASPVPVLPSLWDRTRTDKIPAYGTENAVKDSIRAECKARGWGYDRAAADYFRKVLKARFPEMKFSITSGGAGYLDHVNVSIKAGPYMMETVKGDPDAWDWRERQDRKEPGPELAAVLEYATKLYKAADADDGDWGGDYGPHHDLYGSVYLSDDYTETVQTDSIIAEIMNFRRMKEEADRLEEDVRELISESDFRIRKAEAVEFAILNRAHDEYAAEVQNAAQVEDLPESEHFALTNLSGGIGKESGADELRATIAEHENREDAIITRKVTFTDPDHFTFFEDNFLEDWNFLEGFGGTKRNDARLQSAEDFGRLNAAQRETVSYYMVNCVGIYFGDVLKYVVDSEGFTYARYVYIESNETKRVPAAVYENRIEAESLEKPEIYIPAPLSEQIEAAGLKEGDQITVLRLNSWFISVSQVSGKLLKIYPCKYAQYDNAARVEYIPEGKRKGRYFYITSEPTLIYKGKLPAIPDEFKYRTVSRDNGTTVRECLDMGSNSDDFLKTVLEWHKSNGFAPVIDTFQR